MITAVSTAFVTMAQSRAQRLADIAVTIDLPGGVYPDVSLAVQSVDVEFSATTSQPVRTQPGLPSATASFTLTGQIDPSDPTKTAAWLFRRWNAASPLWHTDAMQALVTISAGFVVDGSNGSAEAVQQFTGYVDSYTCNIDGSVTFQCVDQWTRGRAIPALPGIVASPGFADGLTSEFLLDFMLRQAFDQTISTLPPQIPKCQLFVGFRTSFVAEVGLQNGYYDLSSYTFIPGKYGTAMFGTRNARLCGYTLDTPIPASGKFYAECWASLSDPGTSYLQVDCVKAGGSGDSISFLVGGAPQTVAVGFVISGTPYIFSAPSNIITDTDPHYVSVYLSMSRSGSTTTWSGNVRVDGTSYAITSRTSPLVGDTTVTDAYIIADNIGIEGLQVGNPSSQPASNFGFTPRAVLDPSLNPLQVIPAITAGTRIQDIVTQVCEAELGEAGFDESNNFRFYNRRSIATLTPDRDVTSDASLSNLGEDSVSAAVVNRAKIGFTAWKTGAAGLIWKVATVWRIPAKSTGSNVFVRYITTDTLVTLSSNYVFPLPLGQSPNNGINWFRASSDRAGVNEHPGVVSGTLDLRLTLIAPNQVKVTITNPTNVDAYLVAPSGYTDINAGTPSLWLGGNKLTPDNEAYVDYQFPPAGYVGANGQTGAAGTRWGEQPWQLTGNPLVQDPDAAEAMAEEVVNANHIARVSVSNIAIQLDPTVQLLDWHHVIDPDVTYFDDYVQITNKRLQFQYGQISQSLDGLCASAPGGWLLGVAGRTEINADPSQSTAYLYAE
jgi:hypothetical protein